MTATSLSPSAVHIVVTCTNRKQFSIPSHLRLGSLREHRPALRFAAWTRRLTAEEPIISARDLYGGEHWRVATRLPEIVGDSARLWVCSAGYGLVSVDTALHPYAATFSPGACDSVGRSPRDLQQWWQRLADWPGPSAAQPRSFVSLAQRNPHASIVAVMSAPYLSACAADLREAVAHLSDPDRLVIIGPPRPDADIEDLLVPITARLRPVVGGSLHALYARAAIHLLTAAGGRVVGRTFLRETARQASEAAPVDPSRRAPGVRLPDDAVREFIRRGFDDAQPSATILLRRLRDAGLSCEQSRFKRLYQDTVGQGAVV